MVPSPALPVGALANHGRPKPLFNEMPSGRLTAGSAAVAAPVFPFTLLTNVAFCAVYKRTAPPAVPGWRFARLTLAANAASVISTRPALTSIDRIAPSACVANASGAPKFDVLATRSRLPSSTGCACAASAALSTNGPPRWNVAISVIAPAPGMPVATISALTVATSCVPPADDCGSWATIRTGGRRRHEREQAHRQEPSHKPSVGCRTSVRWLEWNGPNNSTLDGWGQ